MNDLRVLQRIAGLGAATVGDVARLCEMTQVDMRGCLQRMKRKGWLETKDKLWYVTAKGMTAVINPAAVEGL